MSSIFADHDSALVCESKCGGREGVAGSQPMSTAVHITRRGAQINFGDLPPYLTYGMKERKNFIYLLHAIQGFVDTTSVADPDPNRIHRIHMVLGLLDPDPLVKGVDPDPDPSISRLK
jgi:hypothetical protein